MLDTMLILHRPGRSRCAFLGSAFLHAAVVLLVFRLTLPPAAPQPRLRSMTLYLPPAAAVPVGQPPHVRAALKLFYPRPTIATSRPPFDIAPPAPLRATRPAIPETPPPLAPPLVIAPPPAAGPPAPQSPAMTKTGGFASMAAPDAKSPVAERPAQTGSFAAAATAARTGSLAPARLPVGTFGDQRSGTEKPAGRAMAVSAGFDAAVPGRGMGDHGAADASTGGFGAVRIGPARAAVQAQVAVAQFESLAAKPPRPVKAPAAADDRAAALEILNKPRPAYSSEARSLQIEGEVLLEVLFGAGGEIRVLRVLRGLGHGLDQNAIQAATAIRFRPAMEHGQPVDTVAAVRVEFQLAY